MTSPRKIITAFLLFSMFSLAFSNQKFFPLKVHANEKMGTFVRGIIYEDTIWATENSPYVVIDDVVVMETASLIIEPGVTVKFCKETSLIVDGALIAKGNETHKIIFTSNSNLPSPGDWDSIKFRFKSKDNKSMINWSIIEYGTSAIIAESSSPKIYNSVIEKNIVGVHVKYTKEWDFGTPKLQNCTILNNIGYDFDAFSGRAGGIYIDAGGISLENCVIENNGGCGISTSGAVNWISLINCTIRDNDGHGVFGEKIVVEKCLIENNHGDGINAWVSIRVRNSVIRNNAGNGVGAGWKSLTIENSTICNNFGSGIYAFETLNNEYTKEVTISYCKITENKQSGILCSGGNIHYNRVYLNEPFEVKNIGPDNINATYNWWGTTDGKIISQKIYDFYDDYDLGIVFYKPFLILIPPEVSFNYSPENIFVFNVVLFDASNSRGINTTILMYIWDFGDKNRTITNSPIVTHIFNSPGIYNVTLTVIDYLELTNSTSLILTVQPDDIPPETFDDYDGRWHNADFTITLTAIDNESGVAETYYRVNNGLVKAVSVDGPPHITSEGANNTLEYWSVDSAGNEESHKLLTGIKLDKTPPFSSISLDGAIGKNGWFISNVTVTLVAEDLLSGVNVTLYSFNNASWEMYSSRFTINNEGLIPIYFKSIDNAGNIEKVKVKMLKVDITPPTIHLLYPSAREQVKSSTVTIKWSGSDGSSGVNYYEIRLDEGPWINVRANATYTFSGLTEGIHSFTIKAEDIAGNIAEEEFTFVVNTSLIGGPGWIDDIIVFSVTTFIIVVIAYLVKRKNSNQ